MVKLSKHELARRSVNCVNIQINEGDRLGDLVDLYGPDCIVSEDYGYYDDPTTYWLRQDRPETDEEYELRIHNLKLQKLEEAQRKREAKQKQTEADRKIYERLRKKFEKE